MRCMLSKHISSLGFRVFLAAVMQIGCMSRTDVSVQTLKITPLMVGQGTSDATFETRPAVYFMKSLFLLFSFISATRESYRS